MGVLTLERDVLGDFLLVRAEGVARDSNARRRSYLVWAPARKNFLLKILAPPFSSSRETWQEKDAHMSVFFLLVRGRGVEPPRLSALPPQGSASAISPPAHSILPF